MGASETYLLVRSGPNRCGLPLGQVIEVCPVMPVQRLGDGPAFVLGLSRLRGFEVPVLALAAVLGVNQEAEVARFISLRLPGRSLALAVDGVLGLVEISASALRELPPMLAPGNPAIVALAGLDQAVLLLLGLGRIFPPDVSVAL